MVQFSGAEVMPVSAAPCWGRAEVLLVSASPCLCVLYAKLFALLGVVWVRARKSSPCKPKTGEKTLLLGVLGEFFRGGPLEAPCWASFYRETRCCAQVLLAARRRPCRWLWGFALHEAFGVVSPACRSLM